MTRNSNNALQLDRSLGRNSRAAAGIPSPLVLPDSLGSDLEQSRELCLPAGPLHRLPNWITGDHDAKTRTFGSFCQAQLDTDSSRQLRHRPIMDIKRDFAGRLNALLTEAGYPVKFKGRQERLAHELGVTPRAVSNWLNGIKLPAYERVLEIAARFKVSPDWLQTGTGMKRPLTDKEQAHIEDLRQLGVAEQERVYQVTRVFKDPPSDRAA